MKKEKVVPPQKRLKLDDTFNFSCGDGLKCFTKCCADAFISLTPYDVIRIRKGLGMSSGKFLKLYTKTWHTKVMGYPTLSIKLKTDKAKSCPFRASKGCKVYNNRPWVCRMYPLIPVPVDKRPSAVVDWPDPEFELNAWEHCMGFSGGRPIRIREWRKKQGAVEYEKVNKMWKQVTHHKDLRSHNLLRGKAAEQFHLGCYNIDEFKKLVFEEIFQKKFNLSKDILEKVKSDDTELLKVAFLWLRHVLFGENTLNKCGT